jgi:long-chain acyl-CoA synthetase
MSQVTRTFDIIEHLCEHYKKNDILAGKRNGVWFAFNTDDYRLYVDFISIALLYHGFKKGDKILSISSNKPEWNFIDFAMAQIGIIHVPVYANIHTEEYIYIFNHSDAKAIFIGDELLYQRVKPALEKSPAIKQLFSLCKTDCEQVENIYTLINIGKEQESKYRESLQEIRNSITEDEIVTIIYTSGTTGLPKGVMLSHRNLVTNFISTSKIQPLTSKHRVLSFLPLCHVYERMLNYHFQYLGISIYYAENVGTIADNLCEINAHGISTVPRLLESIFNKLQAHGKDLEGYRKKVFFWAVNLALNFKFNAGFWYKIKLFVAEMLVYKKIKASLGGNLRLIVSGGASIQVRLLRFFWAMKIQVLEGYGLTETSPVISVNDPAGNNVRFGTVGPLIENVSVKIADDGEILCKGPNIMLGYYKDKQATNEVIDEEGWFHTGDIGTMEDGKYLKITDRKKEIFKNAGGKYVAPQIIENKLKESIFIEQAFVIGENEKYTSAIISPNFNHAHFWASKHKIHFNDNEELVKNSIFYDRISEEISRINQFFSPHEQIKKYKIASDTWTTQTGELSPTLKIKRKVLYAKYKKEICAIYKCS